MWDQMSGVENAGPEYAETRAERCKLYTASSLAANTKADNNCYAFNTAE